MDGGDWLGARVFERAFRKSDDLLCLIDEDGRVCAASDGWQGRMGWPPHELEGWVYADLVHPEDRAAWAELLSADDRAAAPADQGLHRLRHGTGGHRWLSGRSDTLDLPCCTLRVVSLQDVTEERLRQAHGARVEAVAGVGSWELDPQSGVVYWSPKVFEIHGLEPAAQMPRIEAALDFFPEPGRARIAEAVARLMADGTGYDLQLPFVSADGRKLWVRTTGAAERLRGAPVRFFGTFQDITEARAREVRLSRLSAVAETTTTGVVITDPAGFTEWVNPAFTQLSGYSQDELIGRKPGAVLQTAETDPQTRARIAAALAAEEPIVCEILNLSKDGRPYWILLDIQPLFEPDGQLAAFVAIETDITERREHEATLAAAKAEAQAARAQLAAACEALDDGFALYDASDRLVMCNGRYREIYAASAEVIVPGTRFEDILRHGLARGQYADAVGREDAWLRERLAAHRSDGMTIEQRLGDGRWLRVVEKPTPDGGRVGLRIDITELKSQQAALQAANAELKQALEARDAAETRLFDIAAVSADWFWEQDAQGRFTYLSESFARSTGADPAAFLGHRRDEVARPGEDPATTPDWGWLSAQIAARARFMNFVYKISNAAGAPRWVRISGAPQFDGEGRFAGYRGVGSDVTELTLALNRAEEASRAKSLFLANMSHEIRTPMNGVMGMAAVLDEALTDPAHKQMIAAIRDSGEVLLNIINDILDFSKIEAGKLELERVAFRPSELASRIENLHTMKASEKSISFAVLSGRGADIPRWGDPHRILQILHNLVSNAIKFTETGEVIVCLRTAPERPMVVEVRDTGIGMSEEQAAAVFEDFMQADSSTTRKFGGTGLGMSIVRRLVSAMSGEIELKSRLGEGTLVRVTLPLEVAEDCAVAAPPPRGQMACAADYTLPAGLSVLCADDNRTNRIVLEAMLGRLGVAAEIVSGGRAAVEAAAAAPYDLLLLDISMPEVDGLAALKGIREHERAAGRAPVPAIAVTANAMTHQVESFLAQGFAAHVAKPIRAEQLALAMRSCLEERVSAAV
ncbi:MAG: PAS domain S-box protein [Pikeienuella sp.]